MERNLRLTIAFDGTAYRGWQVQKAHATIQGILQASIRRITKENATLIGSGRTDAGTHARALTANFFTSSQMPPISIRRALNSLLPRDIRVLGAQIAPSSFHARFSARSKKYNYQIYRGETMLPHLIRDHFHYPYPLDLERMSKAAGLFVGKHDFASFAKTEPSAANPRERDTVRQVMEASLKSHGNRLIFSVEANGYLRYMVRTMVGTLLEVGRSRMSLLELPTIFKKRDRRFAGFTAPAHGLILVRVRY